MRQSFAIRLAREYDNTRSKEDLDEIELELHRIITESFGHLDGIVREATLNAPLIEGYVVIVGRCGILKKWLLDIQRELKEKLPI